MFESRNQRRPRSFWVYRGRQLVLAIQDRPGTLHSTAAPPPEGVPAHPFLHGTAYDALSEDELGRLLREAESFDDYVQRLIGAGYDLMSACGVPALTAGACFRLERGEHVVGALWDSGGQFTTLTWQPVEDELVYRHATVTAYDIQVAPALFDLLQASDRFEVLQRALQEQGIRVVPVAG